MVITRNTIRNAQHLGLFLAIFGALNCTGLLIQWLIQASVWSVDPFAFSEYGLIEWILQGFWALTVLGLSLSAAASETIKEMGRASE